MNFERYSQERFRRHLRRKVQTRMRSHMEDELNMVFTPPPNTGKSTGYILNLQDMQEQGTILQPHHELRDEAVEVAEDLDVLNLPRFPDSDLYEDEQIRQWYDRGMPPREIEKRVDVPEDDPYFSVMQEDWDEYDLLVGDPVHAHLDRVVMGRHVAFDDIDVYDSFSTTRSIGDVEDEVAEYLQEHNAPVDNVYDLLDADPDVKQQILNLAETNDSMEDIPYTHFVTGQTNNWVRILAGAREGQRIEWLEYDPCITDGIKKVGFRSKGQLVVVSIPMHLREATTVNFLTATPNLPVIETFFDELSVASDIHTCVSKPELEKYFEDYNIVQTTRYARFDGSGNSADKDRLRALITEFEERTEKTPTVFGSKKALEYEYFSFDEVGKNFAKAIGINQFADVDAAIVAGAPHYGDDYVKRVALFCGVDATVDREDNDSRWGEWQEEESEQIFNNMAKDTVFQTMMRVGREVDGEIDIWVDTAMIPDWVPRAEPKVDDIVQKENDSTLEVHGALGEESTVRDIYERLDFSKRQIYRALDDLAERGLVEVVDSAKYGADVFERLVEELDEVTADAKALTSSLSSISIRRCQVFREVAVDKPYMDGVLTSALGLRQRTPDFTETEDMQLSLGQF